MESAVNLIDSSRNKTKGTIKISAPLYLGRHCFTSIILKFLNKFNDIKIELDLSNEKHDLIRENFDLVIRGAGYRKKEILNDSNLKMKLLLRDNIGLYASESYLKKYGKPTKIDELKNHTIVSYRGDRVQRNEEKWKYQYNNRE